MKETKEERKERQAREAWVFVDLLRRAGNIIEEEVLVPNIDGNKWRVDYLLVRTVPASPVHPHLVFHLPIAIEIQGFGFSHVGRAGWLRDIRKCQAFAANRWLYMPLTWDQVGNGDGLEMLSRCGVPVEPKERAEGK